MANVRILPAAEMDYHEALAWYQSKSEQAAVGFETAIEVALRQIGAGPEHWGYIDDRHRSYVLRRYPYSSIVYQVFSEGAVVVAFAHASRDAFWQVRT